MKHLLGPTAFAFLLSTLACGGGTGADDTTGDGGNGDGSMSDGNGQDSPGNDGAKQDGNNQNDGSAGAINTVFIILMENHGWASINASASAKYIKGTLIPAGGHAEQYFTPAGIHPSEPNYIWLEAGDNLGVTDDADPSANHKATPDHLVSQLVKANISWKSYAEDISGTVCPLSGVGQYAPKHTPQVFFDDVTNTNDPNSANCKQHIRPYTELKTDLQNNTVARYNFITPNNCNDMHGESTGFTCNLFTTDMIKLGDDWLAANVPAILNSSAYKNGGVLFVLWDEGDGFGAAQDGPIPMIVLSAKAKVNYKNSIKYTHSSMLRTIQKIFGVPYLRGAMTSNDLSDFFTSFP